VTTGISKEGNISMTTQVSADDVAQAMALMSPEEKRRFLEKLNAGVIDSISAAEAAEQKKVRLSSVRAARAKAYVDLAASNALAFLDGQLRRAGLPVLEQIAEKGPAMIDNMLASARKPLTMEERIELKGRLHRLGLA
jgi:hypothetical protein